MQIRERRPDVARDQQRQRAPLGRAPARADLSQRLGFLPGKDQHRRATLEALAKRRDIPLQHRDVEQRRYPRRIHQAQALGLVGETQALTDVAPQLDHRKLATALGQQHTTGGSPAQNPDRAERRTRHWQQSWH